MISDEIHTRKSFYFLTEKLKLIENLIKMEKGYKREN